MQWFGSFAPPTRIGNAHVGPVDMTGSDIDRDAIRELTIGDNDLVVRAIRIYRVNSIATQFQEEQSAGAADAR